MATPSGGRPILSSVAVGAASVQLCPANPRRRGLILSNADRNSVLWLAVNQPAAAGQGIQLPAGAPTLSVWGNDWGHLPAAAWFAAATLLGSSAAGQQPLTAQAQGIGVNGVGDVLTLTVPAGLNATLQAATFSVNVGGGATVALILVRSGASFNLGALTGSGAITTPVSLLPGDVVKWRVTVAGAGENADLTVSALGYPVTGTAPGSVNVGVLELEG